MVWILYYLVIYLMVAGIRLSSLWNEKSKNWIEGRKDLWPRLQLLPKKSSARIWFHVSSLGEFEQARPVIEKLKQQRTGIEIILTFFSPSGYLIRSNYALAHVHYLPPDLPGVAEKWIELVQPDVAVFVKYDVWPGYLAALRERDIPAIIISAHWKRGAWLSSWSLPPTHTLLKKCRKIFLQRGDQMEYFNRKGFHNLAVAGDTRVDRCLELSSETARSSIPEVLSQSAPFDLVAGSTWPADEKILIRLIEKLGIKVMLAPHDVSEQNIQRLVDTFPFQVSRLSDMDHHDLVCPVIIIDGIGLLSVLYSLGKVAYIGGGFGAGIHNILEPMAHRKPLIFGPAYKKFAEAVDMVAHGAAKVVHSAEDLEKAFLHFQQPEAKEEAEEKMSAYFKKHSGATDIVTDYILESIPSGRV